MVRTLPRTGATEVSVAPAPLWLLACPSPPFESIGDVPDDSCLVESPSTIEVSVIADRDDIVESDLVGVVVNRFEGEGAAVAVSLDGAARVENPTAGHFDGMVSGA